MTKLAGPAYISDSARTEQNIKDELEAMRSVIGEVGGGYTASGAVTGSAAVWTIQSIAIGSGGALASTPSSNVALITTEGGASADNLATIPSGNLVDGRIIYIKAEASGQTVTVSAGSSSVTGQIVLATNSSGSTENFVLSTGRTLALMLRNTATTAYWQEVARHYGNDQDAERTFLGLGTSATVDTAANLAGTPNSILKVSSAALTNGQFLKVDASGNITGGDPTGGDAATLDGIDSTGFVILNPSSNAEQSLSTPLSVKTSLDIDNPISSGAPTLQYTLDNDARGKIFSDGSIAGGSLTLINTNNSSTYAGIRIDNDIPAAPIRFRYDNSSVWHSLSPGAGNGFDADKLDGLELADILTHTGILSAGTGDERGYIILNNGANPLQFCWGGTQSTQSDGRVRYTFQRAFASTPYIVGGLSEKTRTYAGDDDAGGFWTDNPTEVTTVTATYIEDLANTYDGDPSLSYSSPMRFLAIGTPS
jgi:hypothetical protein